MTRVGLRCPKCGTEFALEGEELRAPAGRVVVVTCAGCGQKAAAGKFIKAAEAEEKRIKREARAKQSEEERAAERGRRSEERQRKAEETRRRAEEEEREVELIAEAFAARKVVEEGMTEAHERRVGPDWWTNGSIAVLRLAGASLMVLGLPAGCLAPMAGSGEVTLEGVAMGLGISVTGAVLMALAGIWTAVERSANALEEKRG